MTKGQREIKRETSLHRSIRRRIPRRLPVCSLLILVGLSELGCRPGESVNPKRPPPNVLLVVLDTTRADYLSCYGHGKPTTPQIDQLAREGIRFERAYSTDFWTLPAHASLMTGLFPSEAKATAITNRLPDDVTTLAERLRAHGYTTGAVVHNAWISRDRGFAQGFEDYVEMWRVENQANAADLASGGEQSGVDRAIAWIETKQAGQESPFFLFVNLNIAHLPYRPPPAVWSRFADDSWPGSRVSRLMRVVGMWAHLAGRIQLDGTDFDIMRSLYEGELARADGYVGQLIHALTERTLLDDTLIIVTSDHGENIGDHGMIDHLLSMYESTLHIPLIVRYPNRFQPGTTSSDLVSLIDVVPTVLDVCGLLDGTAPAGARRISLCGRDRLRRGFITAENERPMNGINLLKRRFPHFDTTAIDCRMRAIRAERFKLIWHEGIRVELFDLESDPHELNNIAAKRPAVREELLRQLRVWVDGIASGTDATAFESDDQESLQRLRSLGYID